MPSAALDRVADRVVHLLRAPFVPTLELVDEIGVDRHGDLSLGERHTRIAPSSYSAAARPRAFGPRLRRIDRVPHRSDGASRGFGAGSVRSRAFFVRPSAARALRRGGGEADASRPVPSSVRRLRFSMRSVGLLVLVLSLASVPLSTACGGEVEEPPAATTTTTFGSAPAPTGSSGSASQSEGSPRPTSVVARPPSAPAVEVRAPARPSVEVQAPSAPSVTVSVPRPPSVTVTVPSPGSIEVR